MNEEEKGTPLGPSLVAFLPSETLEWPGPISDRFYSGRFFAAKTFGT